MSDTYEWGDVIKPITVVREAALDESNEGVRNEHKISYSTKPKKSDQLVAFE